MSSREVVETFLAYRAAQDVEMACALLHDGIVYKFHTSSDCRPFGGEWHGVESCRHVLFSILEDFDYLRYEASIASVRGNVVRVTILFAYRHRLTGGVLEGTRRLIIRVKGDRISRIDGFHDARLVEAFMRLTKHRLASNQIIEAPSLPKREKQGST